MKAHTFFVCPGSVKIILCGQLVHDICSLASVDNADIF
nr:MAG TPA: hypothetical protein [Bacteriophage sp.]